MSILNSKTTVAGGLVTAIAGTGTYLGVKYGSSDAVEEKEKPIAIVGNSNEEKKNLGTENLVVDENDIVEVEDDGEDLEDEPRTNISDKQETISEEQNVRENKVDSETSRPENVSDESSKSEEKTEQTSAAVDLPRYRNVSGSSFLPVRNSFSCETFKPGSIGYRFRNDLICDPNDSEWDRKLEHWKTNLNDKVERHLLVGSKFNPKNKNNLTKTKLQARCSNALIGRDWNVSGLRERFAKEKYWAEVKNYCTKSGTSITGWYSH
ncbi:hypothetical protein [Candidatus Mycoplasma haematohominis]|uniref:Uncharacterized protein n=1 Tax=Candidatus Mycoplasma haematohominis TaxID=1494318 RepID=A0A478FQI4_9MOLU|nr:hypothetical protein [Candidatus Mycoplasma haemohominis]GCE63818.1 hypothetical protein MHSWG343_08250 [Candidatus Mycoplasma haemohominis]